MSDKKGILFVYDKKLLNKINYILQQNGLMFKEIVNSL